MGNLTYHVRMPKPHTHYFEVELIYSGTGETQTDFSMAVWTPGSYLVREYSKNLEQFSATNAQGQPLETLHAAKNRWRIASEGNAIHIHYRIYAFEETVRTNHLTDDHVSIIPAALFLWPESWTGGCQIQFYPAENWKCISTALPMVDNNIRMRAAENRDELIDSPVEIGNHVSVYFTAAGVEHEIAVVGPGNFSLETLKNDFKKIVEEEVKIFRQHPCKKYLFILQNTNGARGGLEHLHSTSLIAKRFSYLPEKNYNDLLSLVSHEYFHLWNVKRLRPFALGPFNYNEENYTTSLWIAEGFTNYYDDLILRRAGFLSVRNYLDIAEKNINDTENAAGNAVHPVAEASFEAWIKYYRQNENAANAQVNYYTKGGVLAMLLDMMIVAHSGGENNLDLVMREAYETFYIRNDRGYTEAEFKQILEKYTGTDLGDFYAAHVYGTRQIDYNRWLLPLGMKIHDANTGLPDADLGMQVNEQNIITFIKKDGSAENGKLNVNDEILAINNYRYNNSLLTSIMLSSGIGHTLQILVNRNGIIRNFEVTIGITLKKNYQIALISEATPYQQRAFCKWLSTDTFSI